MTVNPTSSAAPAGWYKDPLGLPQLRWWNGIGWTNNIQETRTELHSWGSGSQQLVSSVA
ncbi:hypothetical protein BH11ACT3_BH11ACT3_24520 [soil metagenome]